MAATGGRWRRGGRYNNRGGYRGGRGRGRGRGYHNTEDDEGDVLMGESKYGGLHYGGTGSRGRERSPERSGSSKWWEATVIDGKKHSRDWLLKRLKDTSRIQFHAAGLHLEGKDTVFFVDDESVAEALRDTSNRITTKTGSKIIIVVKPSDVGPIQRGHGARSYYENENLNEEQLTVLKHCLGRRYDLQLLKLDLSKLSSDVELRKGNIYGRVEQPKFMNSILDLIYSVCPNLKILDLSNNHITKLDNLTDLAVKCPALEELNLSNNNIRFTGELSKIRDHKTLTKVWFKGNECQLQFTNNNSSYLAEIRKHLSNVKFLDGFEMPAAIKFDLETESNIPSTKDVFFVDGKDYEVVKRFVQNFFQVYDDNDRQKLFDAYHNDAAFSLCCNSYLATQNSKSNSLSHYIKISRNLRNIKDTKLKSQLIKHKKINIVAFLTELPQTKHCLNSFSLDLTLTTLHMLCFTVQGIFLEGKDKIPRGFSRTFIAVRQNDTAFLVINDQLHIRNLTLKQDELLEKLNTNVPADTPQAHSGQYTKEQQDLVEQFSADSNMNLQYSLMCLEAAGWNYHQAGVKFLESKSSGIIPPEAFVHS